MEPYCVSRSRSIRRHTREVKVGMVGVGSSNPLRIQSMTTTDTLDVEATAKQSIELAEAGCEIIRITAPNVRASTALGEIARKVREAGVDAPLVADIHFLPEAALEAAKHVEKVRINPGNYADRKKFAVREYSDAEYEKELERLEEAFSPLVERCKELGRSMRIGTNHGSLSDRILNRYGDTPRGMVESALEFVRIAEARGYGDMILSMKASNPKVMIEAYRLIAACMDKEGMSYPLHLGVTEAGDGEDARIKSAVGIGSLLLDGLGDTIRVSLTEDPVREIPVARELAQRIEKSWIQGSRKESEEPDEEIDPFSYERRDCESIDLGHGVRLGPKEPPRVVVSIDRPVTKGEAIAQDLKDAQSSRPDAPIEGIHLRIDTSEEWDHLEKLAGKTGASSPFYVLEFGDGLALDATVNLPPRALLYRSFSSGEGDRLREFLAFGSTVDRLLIVGANSDDLRNGLAGVLKESKTRPISTIRSADEAGHVVAAYRDLASALHEHGLPLPLWIRFAPQPNDSPLGRLLDASILSGSLLCDGIGDLLGISGEENYGRARDRAYDLLQGSRARISKTEFVVCPSCGRTLFDLESTTQRVKESTGHLKGVTIAVMGCIVNGPGEMADADFGYVGTAPGKVDLYVGKQRVQSAIVEAEAVNNLVGLIKEEGKWIDP
ncbi:MAG: 4-hydroxy-3-methylbut-2-en-1-yl diphosphate synthase [Opitutales bacterium]|nr:4-hydroxy-3-methylbut-2-en-1-yl diphosphate synthase [Opitutales bacterium]